MPEKPTTEDKKTRNRHSGQPFGNWWLIFGGITIFIIAFAIGFGSWRWHSNQLGLESGGRFGRFMTHRMGWGDNDSVLSSSQDRVSGTVTAVNGSTFTVAGNGSSYQVQTNSSTQYQNGNSVKVNDTVIALGTTNNGVLTATQVAINP